MLSNNYEIIFIENDNLEEKISKKCPEIDWEIAFFKKLPENILKNFINKIKIQSHPFSKYFLMGVLNEFGILQEIDIEKSISLYIKGAFEYHESFCYFRLYHLIRNKKKKNKFNLENHFEVNRNIEILFLLKACAYSFSHDSRFENTPSKRLISHFSFEDITKIKITQLCSLYKKKDKENYYEYHFLDLWFKKALSDYNLNDFELFFKEESFLLEGIYTLGDEHSLNGNYLQALNCFEICIEKGLLKCFLDIGNVYEDMGNIQKAAEFYKIGADNGCYLSSYRYASYLFKHEIDLDLAFQYLLFSFCMGRFLSIDILISLLNKEFFEKIKYNYDLMINFQLAESVYHHNSFYMKKNCEKYGFPNLCYSSCFEKGIVVEKNLRKVIEILDNTEKITENKRLK